MQKIFFILENLLHQTTTLGLVFKLTSKLNEIEERLEILGACTTQLILKCCFERHKKQNLTERINANLGFLTVRAYYSADTSSLKIQLMNARNLKQRGGNGNKNSSLKNAVIKFFMNLSTIFRKRTTKSLRKSPFGYKG